MFIKDISGKTMRALFEIEKDLPPNINKPNRYKDLSLQEIAQLNADEEGETVELSTALQRVTRIGTAFNWALDEDDEKWGFQRGRNPCSNFKKKHLTKEEEATLDDSGHTRRAFSDEDLRRLFTGQVTEGRGKKELGYGYGAKRFKRRYQYWLSYDPGHATGGSSSISPRRSGKMQSRNCSCQRATTAQSADNYACNPTG